MRTVSPACHWPAREGSPSNSTRLSEINTTNEEQTFVPETIDGLNGEQKQNENSDRQSFHSERLDWSNINQG